MAKNAYGRFLSGHTCQPVSVYLVIKPTDMNNTRRDFLQKLSASAFALPVISNVFNSEEKEFDQTAEKYDGPVLRVVICGLGSYGTRVADAMVNCKQAKLVGAVSGTPSKLTAWQGKYGIPAKNCYNYETMDEIKNNPDIDAVYVTTPNSLHKDQVIRIAKAGKHAISEKPM